MLRQRRPVPKVEKSTLEGGWSRSPAHWRVEFQHVPRGQGSADHMPRAHTHSARIPRTVEPESCFMGKFPPPATTWSLEPLPLQPFEAMVAEELLQWGPVRQLEIRGREMRGPVAGGHRCSKPPVEMQNQEEMIPLKLDSANFGEHTTEIVLSRRAGVGVPPPLWVVPPLPTFWGQFQGQNVFRRFVKKKGQK